MLAKYLPRAARARIRFQIVSRRCHHQQQSTAATAAALRHSTTPTSRHVHSPPRSRTTARTFTSCPAANMSDADYAAFLNKSSKDYSKPATSRPDMTTSQGGSISSNAHPTIKALGERFYTSDSDEPFQDIAFGWDGEELPGTYDFASLISVAADEVDALTTAKWDSRNQYSDVVDAVEKAAKGGKATVFRVAGGGARAVYYVLALSKQEGRLVGVQAKAVES